MEEVNAKDLNDSDLSEILITQDTQKYLREKNRYDEKPTSQSFEKYCQIWGFDPRKTLDRKLIDHMKTKHKIK